MDPDIARGLVSFVICSVGLLDASFPETHRTVLNQILRQSTTHLADGPFSVLVDYTKVLDFDVKRRYFRQELDRLDEGMRREDLAIHIHRDNVFEDAFRDLHRKTPEEWKHRFYIVFEGNLALVMLSMAPCHSYLSSASVSLCSSLSSCFPHFQNLFNAAA